MCPALSSGENGYTEYLLSWPLRNPLGRGHLLPCVNNVHLYRNDPCPIEKCWICGAPADSAEHRFKKSDMVCAHGRGSYDKQAAPFHLRTGQLSRLQGPNAKLLKYAENLCHQCNTTFTQPFDHAYDCFISWVMNNETDVTRRRFIRFPEVFGAEWEEEQRNLYKYFAKSLGAVL
jgi:hypothetical protein